MGDFPDPDEEYELMYSDDLELIREIDDGTDSKKIKNKVLPAKRSLDFSSPVQKPLLHTQQSSANASSLSESYQSQTDIISSIPTKRTAEDLFGDINDIDFDDLGLPSKRQKTEEENDLELINKIIESRKMRQMLSEPNRALLDNMSNYNVSKNLSLKIPK
ncbi:unnamed protein product [Danaus chrysippus]|nr:unnamed protein product [Danaus chrysippus]